MTPSEIVHSLLRNKTLIYELVKREVTAKYKGSVLGVFWSVLQPIAMLLVYTFVFSVVLKAKWSVTSESKTEFAMILFPGLIVFNYFAECLTKSPGQIVGNANLVKKVVFPVETLLWVVAISGMVQLTINLFVWLIFYIAIFGAPHLTVFLFPLVVLPVILLSLGFGWLFASLGTYLRDVSQILTILITIMLFLSPVFFPISALPKDFQFLFILNPLTVPIENARLVLFYGLMPNLSQWFVYMLLSALICWLGFAWFQKTRKGFADVL